MFSLELYCALVNSVTIQRVAFNEPNLVALRIMQLPNHQNAQIASEKVREYLLSDTHPIGRYKAAVFRSLGYTSENWETLLEDLRNLLILNAEKLEASDFGTKYAIRGAIHGPSGRTEDIVSIWIIRTGEDFPRFITAYPE